MRLLERKSQIDALGDYAREARLGQGRLVLVSGEAGVGKSSLLEQLEADLPETHWFWGACDGLFTPRPLGPLLDIATQLGGELAALCGADAPREELFAALLRQMREPGGLRVFAMEDVHWADEATLDLLRFLGRRLRDAHALIVVTYRDEGLAAGDPLRIALGELSTQRSTRRLSLPRLSAQAVAVLAAGTGLEPAQLHQLTGGNPFYLHELLQHGAGELPTSARDAVLAHVARLTDPARQVLDVAALMGARIEPELLVETAECPPAVLDEIVDSGVLTEDGGVLRFRHEIARLAVEQTIAVHRRAPIHRRILGGLLAAGCDDDARLAFHAEGADDGAKVLVHAPLAARRASELAAHREAVAQYTRALRFAAGGDPRTTAGLYDGLAYESSLVDQWQASADACDAALVLWRAVGDPVRQSNTLVMLARAMWRLCRGREANEAAAAALAVIEDLGPSTELAWAYAHLAARRMEQSEPSDAIELSHRAQALAEQLQLPDVRSDALNTEGCATFDIGGEWLPLMRQSLDIALSRGLQEQAGRAYANLYALHHATLRLAEGERYFVDGVAYCDEHDISTFGTCLRGERTSTLDMLGRWDDAAALATRLLEQVASPVNRLNALLSLGKIRARRDDPAAWECLDEASTATDWLDEPQWIVPARLARAEARWLQGDLDAAARELDRAEAAGATCELLLRSEIAAWRHRVSGDVPSATGLAEPYASQIAGDHLGAAKRWDDLGCPYLAALALLGATDEGALRDSLVRLERLGATAAARLARRKMREHGVKSIPSGARSTTRANPAGLTRREHEVLELMCDGHTNDEISGRLFISVKTVDHHVSAVLGKLGVGSRKIAASEAVRLGLVGARR